MKILNVNKFYYLKGGSETYYFSLRNILQKNGHKVIPFAMADKNNFDTPYSKYFVDNIDYSSKSLTKKIRNGFKIIYSMEAKKKIAALLDKVKPDIAHLHIFQHQLSVSILPQLKKRGIPIVYTVHDYKLLCPNYKMLSKGKPCEKCINGNFYNCLLNKCSKNSYAASLLNTIEMYFHRLKKYYNLIDVFVAPSRFLRKKMIDFGFDKSKVVHIPNFVESGYTMSKNGDGDYILFFGRLSNEKGVFTLIKAMQKVQSTQLYIAGTGPLKQQLKAYVERNRLSNVHFVGFRIGADLKKLISNSLFTVLPSEWYENNPLSLLESFAYGKAVIGSNIGGIPEIIKDNVNGLLFEPGDCNELAEKINMLADNEGMAKSLGSSGKKYIENFCNVDIHYENLVKIYERLLS